MRERPAGVVHPARATVEAAAPGITGVEFVAEAAPALYQIGMGPPGAAPEGRAS
jgi:hypothetical protein